jgi:two-component system phosphate regulon sensor histidine kinase PhoR
MVEGVLAVDAAERLITINKAAATFFEVDPEFSIGKIIQEVIRNTDLQEFIGTVLSRQITQEKEITFFSGGEELFIRATGTILLDTNDRSVGVVVVLNDITRLRRLENMRREFVANVSHELKTPVTSIKGYIETLLEGAKDEPDTAMQFLQVAARQTDRLNAIIEDLLSLSRIEQEAEADTVKMEKTNILKVLQSAVQTCRVKAEAKNIKIELDCHEDLSAPVNAPLLEQAIVNLVDNALKYSDADSEVAIKVSQSSREISITVIDHGRGITREHLPRLFERFYRVDKDRSREIGGTGLGLAIVKHIALAHQGRVNVESKLGQGSKFLIHIPLK